MKKLAGAALVSFVALSFAYGLSACPKSPPAPPNNDSGCSSAVDCCKTDDCSDVKSWLCASSQCIFVCQKNSECTAAANQVCDEGVCRAPACASDAECTTGANTACLGGTCQPPVTASAVKSCSVLPAPLLIHEGSTRQLSVVTQDAKGNGVAYKGAVTWDSSDKTKVSVNATTGVVVGGSIAGDATVGASIVGGPTCTLAKVTNFNTEAAGKVRVIVADQSTQDLISTATVVLNHDGADDTLISGVNGVYEFNITDTTALRDVHVFEAAHTYLSVLGVNSNDLVIYLVPELSGAQRAGFAGVLKADDFKTLDEQGGEVHIALYGASIFGSFLDLGLSTLVGDFVPTTITGITSSPVTIPIPSGAVLGLQSNMFKSNYAFYSTPGRRALWGMGGNSRLAEVVKLLGPVLGGGNSANLDIGALLNNFLPLLNKSQSGVLAGQIAEQAKNKDVTIPLTTPLRLKIGVQLPTLPLRAPPPTDPKQSTFVDGVLIIAGGAVPAQGLVPLGLTAGLDKDSAGVFDGKVGESGSGLLPLRLSPLHDGLETGGYGFLAMAISFPSVPTGPSAPAGTSSLTSQLAISVIDDFTQSPKVKFDLTNVPKIDLSQKSFMELSKDVAYDYASRQFTLGTPTVGANLNRFDVLNGKGKGWVVYFSPTGKTTFPMPPVPDNIYMSNGTALPERDPFANLEVPDTTDPTKTKTAKPRLLMQSVSVTADVATVTDAQAILEGIATFNSHNLDDLSLQMDRFTVSAVNEKNKP